MVHIILILDNIIISVFASIMAGVLFPEIGPISSKLVGGVVFLLGLQLQVIYVMHSNKEDATERLMALHQDYQVYQDHLEQTKEETIKLREQVKTNEKSQNN